MPDKQSLEHGGRLRRAARQYGIALSHWLDLSTGINPDGWPVPALPPALWSRLPEEDDGLEAAARDYYGVTELLPVAGSQVAIQVLPALWPRSRVTVVSPSYAEHGACWRAAGHEVVAVSGDAVEAALPTTDVLVLVNPNNPTGQYWPAGQLLDWHERLAARGGCLIVDEAFIDSTPEESLAPRANQPGLIVLRSLGKFFGLAGLRVGFVCAQTAVLTDMRVQIGPWHLSTPARWIATRALEDRVWQEATQQRLQRDGQRLGTLLADHGLAPTGGCPLFQWTECARAGTVHEMLAREAILTRRFSEPAGLRFGLPGNEAQWQRLATALARLPRDQTGAVE